MRITSIALLIVLLVCPALSSQSQYGWICVSPVPVRPPSNYPLELCKSGNLSLRVDAREQVPWPHKESIKIDRLDLAQKHSVVASCDGKPVQSFRFHFSEYQTSGLCLVFEEASDNIYEVYEGLRLWDARHVPWCKKSK
jgi:hypothetical protein